MTRPSSEPTRRVLKTLMIGASESGKTAMTSRLFNNEFPESHIATLSIEFFEVDYKGVKLQIWDTAGDEKYSILRENVFRNTESIVLTIDLTNPNTSFRVLSKLSKFIPNDTEIVIAYTKRDLVKSDPTEQEINTHKAAITKKLGISPSRLKHVVITSAQQSIGLDSLLDKITTQSRSSDSFIFDLFDGQAKHDDESDAEKLGIRPSF